MEEKITNCTICNELSLVKSYLDEEICIVCHKRLSKFKGPGIERIRQLREKIYGRRKENENDN